MLLKIFPLKIIDSNTILLRVSSHFQPLYAWHSNISVVAAWAYDVVAASIYEPQPKKKKSVQWAHAPVKCKTAKAKSWRESLHVWSDQRAPSTWNQLSPSLLSNNGHVSPSRNFIRVMRLHRLTATWNATTWSIPFRHHCEYLCSSAGATCLWFHFCFVPYLVRWSHLMEYTGPCLELLNCPPPKLHNAMNASSLIIFWQENQ